MSDLPIRLSPSRAGDFVQCPKLFYYKTILKRPTYSSLASATGRLTHQVLDELYELPPEQRTPQCASALVQPSWNALSSPFISRLSDDISEIERRIRDRMGLWREVIEVDSLEEEKINFDAEDYQRLISGDTSIEEKIISDATRFTKSYFKHENPEAIHPVGRELHLSAEVKGVSIHGFIDRLDEVNAGSGSKGLVITDYKTGKTPSAERLTERTLGVEWYALMVAENYLESPKEVRLLYVRANEGNGLKVFSVSKDSLEKTSTQLVRIREQIEVADEKNIWVAQPGPLCSYCDFRPECPEGLAYSPEYSWRNSNRTGFPMIDSKSKTQQNTASSNKFSGPLQSSAYSNLSRHSPITMPRSKTSNNKRVVKKAKKRSQSSAIALWIIFGFLFSFPTFGISIFISLIGICITMSNSGPRKYRR